MILDIFAERFKANTMVNSKNVTLLTLADMHQENKNPILQELDNILAFNDSVIQIFNQEQKKLPFHLNLIDIITANENDHSRILGELLKHNNDGYYEILDSFLANFINGNCSVNLRGQRPIISCGTDMIDLLITEQDYAVIIENKIHGAVDRPSQIANYIDKLLRQGYKNEDIYIIYLTRDGSKEITIQSLKNNHGVDYLPLFTDRYLALSYRNDILPWLKEIIIPDCRIKEIFLKSAIEQYIDHLEGLFNIRITHKAMNTEIEKHIKSLLNLDSVPESNLSILNEKIEELTKTTDRLNEIKLKFQKECFQKWLLEIENNFPDMEIFDESKALSFPKIGIKMAYKGYKFCVLIEFDNHGKLYYGIGRHYASPAIIPELKEILKPVLNGFKTSVWWYGIRSTSFTQVGELFTELVNKTQQHLYI